MNKVLLSIAVCLFLCTGAHAQDEKPLLMQQPTLNATHIVFAYAGDLWTVGKEGGAAIKLTSGPSQKSNPKFSPDGRWIAFTGGYNGNANVYVMPAEGGQPRQLTYSSGWDMVEGWTPDGQNILFQSLRDSFSIRYKQLYTISVQGGFAKPLPLPMGYQGSYSSDGSHLAYTPLPREIFFGGGDAFMHAFWAHYHGGLAAQVWIADLADSSVIKIPHENASDFNPMWVGSKIYFLSARAEPISLYVYDTATKKVSQVIQNSGMDIMSASAGPGAIVYEQFGSLHLYDLASGRQHEVHVTITGDFPQVRPHFEKVADHILNYGISPTGARAVFEAHGEILTVPSEKGSIRNITNSPGVADRSPAWSSDGKSIAYFSDESGAYALHIKNQDGMGQTRSIGLGEPSSYFSDLAWSPDSRKLVYTDKRLNVWYLDLDHPVPVKVDTDVYFDFMPGLNPSWSPDSHWIVYTKLLRNHLRAVFVYSLDTGKAMQITDGLSDVEHAVFDKSGKYLYFTASTNAGPAKFYLDMSSDPHRVTSSVYVAVLRKNIPSPLAPQSDEETTAANTKTKPAQETPAAESKNDNDNAVQIDIDHISQRILALPIPAADYTALHAGKAGEIYLLQTSPETHQSSLIKFSMTSRKATPLLAGIQDASISFDGGKFLYQQGDKWGIASTAAPVKPGQGLLNMEAMQVWVVPREEWDQMYREVWRIEHDYFYASNYDGVNLAATEKEYAPYVPGIKSREDLNYLFREMLGKLSTGHTFVGGGDIPSPTPISVGLLGADYSIENDHYRFKRIYSGENWNPGLRAPLTEPGIDVNTGDYLLAVNGRELHGSDNIYSFFLNTADQQVVLKVGPNPDGSGAREVTVVPIGSEIALRGRNWIFDNLRKVDQLSGGKVAYVYLPNTAEAGFTSFNRYFFAQVGKQGVIVDDRFNSGGQAADYIIQYLQRTLWNYWYTPNGAVQTEPGEAIFGPKVMLINPYAGSGGDLIPWFFRHNNVGTLIGERTWGGEVGITGYPPLIDGGMVTAPSLAFFTTQGKWGIENKGVAPDIEVPMDPSAWRQGRDPQLEKAVQVVLEQLKAHPLPTPTVPSFPVY
ncbi:MAG TPA: PDZ domain-containing protein [Acidobacteriaceae bacterium]|jgi:tricorn protease|nr:PDZ domain-containing protein [Acidobacteriaceae bacterium]